MKKENQPDTKPGSKPGKNKTGKIRENISILIIAVLLAIFIRSFIIEPFKIPSGSMKETLKIGDHILVSKFIYGIKLPIINKTIIPVRDPEKGEIVVFRYPRDRKKNYIKRVIGTAGDKIRIKDKKLYVNDAIQSHDFTQYMDNKIYPAGYSPRDNYGPVTVPKDHIFVMGDNRDNSQDSRYWGFVNLNDLKGEALIVYWSWNKENSGSFFKYIRWNRIGHIIN